MKHNPKTHHGRWWLLIPVLVSAMLCVSCREDYFYDEQEPEWLGESIYDFLVEQKKYTNYVRLIEDLNYKEVLAKTGSKTLFVVDDDAFNEFFKPGNNEWGVTAYGELTNAQKEQILFSSMLNNVFFSDMLGDSPGEGQTGRGMSMRRTSSLTAGFAYRLGRSQFPENFYWSRDLISSDTIYLTQDNTVVPMVVFTNSYLVNNALKGSDYAFITSQPDTYVYSPTDVFINGVRIIEPNLKCKNGVVHRLEKLSTPLTNMAEVVCRDRSTQRFGELLDRFSAPFLSTGTIEIADGSTRPVYVKKYFTTRGHNLGLEQFLNDPETPVGTNVEFMTTPTDSAVGAGLKFDPGWNTLTASDVKPMNQDMAAMFVPTDEALDNFLEHGSGKFLFDKYGGWDEIPDHVLADLLNNHMKSSFANSVPSKFAQVKNDAQIDMGIEDGDVMEAILCCNGVVYRTNKVYAPVSYVAVTAPTLVNDNMNIMRWSVEQYGFLAYLHSMDSYYSYLLPTDEEFWYLDPLSVALGEPEYWKFWYNDDLKKVEVMVYDSLRTNRKNVADKHPSKSASAIQNRLEDIIDQHIIVDSISEAYNGKYYYQTKGNGTVKVLPSATSDGLDIYGGFQVENKDLIVVPSTKIMPGENGKTYIMPSLAQSPMKSVYSAMKAQAGDETAPFYQFFNLMQDAGVFIKDDTYAMSDEYTVDIFNTYHYTIYVPSNDSILKAIERGLPTMEAAEDSLVSWGIDLEGPEAESYLNTVRTILHDFVCYHIHDNSVYVGGTQVNEREYQTGTLDTEKRFRRLTVTVGNSSLVVKDGTGNVHNVKVNDNGESILYNVMTRDYLFNDGVSGVSEKDLNITDCKQIETSSFAVIHGIDGVLLYKDKIGEDKDGKVLYKEQFDGYKKMLENVKKDWNK